MDLLERDRRVLEALVRCYIDTGEAVSSLWLADRGRFGISSATLRNILGRLEEAGYVRQPHTSAGRVPTDRGYRVHVDQLLSAPRPARAAADLAAAIQRAPSLDEALAEATGELSRASHHIGFVLAPAPETATLSHIEFVPLEMNRVLVVLVAGGGQITHKVVEVTDEFAADELRKAAAYLNTEFTGRTLAEVRDAIIARMHEQRNLYDALMARALELAQSSLAEIVPSNSLLVQGASLLVDELAEEAARAREEQAAHALETLRALLSMIEEKHRLVRLLSTYLDRPGLTIVIGSEHAVRELEPFSVVVSTYDAGGRTGAVGVIGPTRMRYSKAISLVDAVAHAISVKHDHA